MVKVFKKLIAPIQKILMQKGICPGCGRPLAKGKRTVFKEKLEKVVCRCGRVFIFDKSQQRYRRALIGEV